MWEALCCAGGTVLHELGHWVDYRRLGAVAFHEWPASEIEVYAHRYFERLAECLRARGRLPFERKPEHRARSEAGLWDGQRWVCSRCHSRQCASVPISRSHRPKNDPRQPREA